MNNLTPEIICRAAENKDKLAFNLLNKTGEYLGRGIANVVNFLNPELIILNGGIAKAGEILISSFKKTLREKALETAYKNLRIETSSLGDMAGAQGAALMALNHFFEVFNRVFCSYFVFCIYLCFFSWFYFYMCCA